MNLPRETGQLDGYMFVHEYLANELLKGNKPQDLNTQHVANRQASNLERRKESKKKSRKESKHA